MRVCFTNLGCKLNQAEIERLAREFHRAGHRVVPTLEEAELHVVNSCTVTHRAARDSRKVARRGGRRVPGLKTVLTGCYATGSPEEAAALAGVDLVVPNHEKERLLDRVHAAFPEWAPGAGEAPPTPPGPVAPLAFGNTRAPVKVEDGCNVGCAFCIIPSTRGRQQSRPLPEVVAEVGALARSGVREVVVTGVQISHYRWQGRRLADLVAALLAETRVPRIRLSSIAPWAFDRRLLELWTDRRLCRHVHMSLQSGSDHTLARMRRPYDTRAYREVVTALRAAVPGVAVTTDVIVGFPGETADEFEESRGFVAEIGFARTHVFPYSPRPGTEAAGLPGRVAAGEIKRRSAAMLETAAEAEGRFLASHRGARVSVLWEEEKGGRWHGLTDNYLRVAAAAPPGLDLTNVVSEARVVGLAGSSVLAELAAAGDAPR